MIDFVFVIFFATVGGYAFAAFQSLCKDVRKIREQIEEKAQR